MANFKLDNSSDWETIEIVKPKSLHTSLRDDDDWETVEVSAEPKHTANLRRAGLTALNGAAFGAFPEIAGRVKGQARGMRDFAKSLLLNHELANPRSDAQRKLNREEYLKTKNFINSEIQDFADEHPSASVIADIAGSLPTAAIIPGGSVAKGAKLLGKAAKAAKAGAIFGGARSAGESVNADANLADIIKSALKGSGIGAAAGGAMGTMLAPFTSSKLSSLEKAVGKNRIARALESGTPLLENADEKTLQFAQGIKTRGNAKALQRFKNFEKKLEFGQKEKIDNIIDKHISDDNYNELLKKVQSEGKEIYEPLYAEAMKSGKISRSRTAGSKVLKDYFARARKFSDELKGLPDDDARVLQRVKERLGDDITKYTRAGEKSIARDLSLLNKDLVADIDDNVLQHAKARQAYRTTKQKEAALKRGFEDVPKATLDEIEAMEALGLNPDEENKLLRGGAAQFFKNKNFNAPKNKANLYKNIFQDDDLERLVKAKILSPERAKAVKDAAHAGQQGIDNVHRLTSGSQTAEKLFSVEGNNPLRWGVSPKKKLVALSDKAWRRIGKGSDDRAAKLLTNNLALKQAILKKKKPISSDEILYKILGGHRAKTKEK